MRILKPINLSKEVVTEICTHQEQGALDLSQAGTLLRMSLEDLVQMSEEPPIKGFLRLALRLDVLYSFCYERRFSFEFGKYVYEDGKNFHSQ